MSVNESVECVSNISKEMLEATGKVLGVTCDLECEPQEDSGQFAGNAGIIGIVPVVGDVDWSVSLGLPRETAAALATMFAGFEISFDSEDMGDAIGELTNIVAGEVKRMLDAKGLSSRLSTPTVVRAEDLQMLVQRNVSMVKMCFASPLGPLWAGIAEPVEGSFMT